MSVCRDMPLCELDMDQFPAVPQRTVEYMATPATVGEARRETVQALKDWGLLALIDAAELLVSELVTNSVKVTSSMPSPRTDLLGPQRIMLQLRLDGPRLLILVWDRHPNPPVLQEAGLEAERGRGLHLVDTLSSDWGYYPGGNGKVVWCALSLEPS